MIVASWLKIPDKMFECELRPTSCSRRTQRPVLCELSGKEFFRSRKNVEPILRHDSVLSAFNPEVLGSPDNASAHAAHYGSATYTAESAKKSRRER